MQTNLINTLRENTEQRLPVSGAGGKDELQPRRRKLMGGGGRVLYLDCVGDFTVVSNCQNSSNSTIKID